MNHHRCKAGAAVVDLIAPAALVAQVAEIMAPFVLMAPVVPTEARRWWQVRVATVAPSGYKPVHVLSNGELPMRLWLGADRQELVVDVEAPEAFVVQCLVRYLRELLRFARVEDLFLHAGLVARDDLGVALIGDKRAGKTSTLTALMLAGWRFVGNDDVSFAESADGWLGYGWPRTVRVRNDTFAVLGIDPNGVRSSHPARPSATSRLLRPAELTAVCDAEPPLAHARVRALVFPAFAESHEPSRLIRLTPDQAAVRLSAAVERARPKNAFLAGMFPVVSSTRIEARIASLASAVPAYAFTQHFRALRTCADVIKQVVQTGDSNPA
ncbi:hypothetical protein ACWEPC_00460 [Nonomuraea sp. NPDC004297]